MKKALSLSIIIPVYNEEFHIKACLEAISRQTVMPEEVIVVDNNCTDRTIAIAKHYDFVRIVTERQQGRGAARNAGFSLAKSDILGRIDADSIIEPDWVERTIHDFKSNAKLGGVTGLGFTDGVPRYNLFTTVFWTWIYFVWTDALYGLPVLWGANMAIRRTVWEMVKEKTCIDDLAIHEDHDISLLISAVGYDVMRDNKLRVFAAMQSVHYFPKLVRYTWMRTRTKRYHQKNGSFKTIVKTLSVPQRIGRYILLAIPGIPFYIVSFLLWPLDELMRALGRARTWLD